MVTTIINTATYHGIKGDTISVEVDITNGMPYFNIVGLPDTSVKESKERVRSSLLNTGFEFPIKRITVNLSPANIKKQGSHFDLPIAIGILCSSNQIFIPDLDEYFFIGELSLNGELKKVTGALPIVLEGINRNIKNFIVPKGNEDECGIIKNANIYSFERLVDVIDFLINKNAKPYKFSEINKKISFDVDFSEIIGQNSCKRSIEVAAAGGHNILMYGPPGVGKTMLAQRIPTILPVLSYEEAIEVTKIYSITGQNTGLIKYRPFRNPHYTSSEIALVGGGNNLMPGEISLAHNGILFLDELLEFTKTALEVLRLPLENRQIEISKCNGTVTYPANFMLVGAMNPCPCGYFLSGLKECICTPKERERYLKKLSRPLLDRIDIISYVNSVPIEEIRYDSTKNESSETIRKRVEKARNIQRDRFKKNVIHTNSQMNSSLLQKYCKINLNSEKLIYRFYKDSALSLRAYNKILKVSRTIADLDNRENILEEDIIEAIQYRKDLNTSVI